MVYDARAALDNAFESRANAGVIQGGMDRESLLELAATVAGALATADRLELWDVAISLDAARLQLDRACDDAAGEWPSPSDPAMVKALLQTGRDDQSDAIRASFTSPAPD